jgi:hypothetical protein
VTLAYKVTTEFSSGCTTKPVPREKLTQAIANAFESKKLKKLPVKPRKEITHLMAKAAADPGWKP